ncbi:MAG TPA: ABC transporter ATP-binding protein [Anaerolineae bacterium]|nr:ABC transporter ATP-binding protein [Anaerolineae bacterium]
MSKKSVICVEDVVKTFAGPAGAVTILKNISFEIGRGEFVGVVGPSGSGKSTAINMITGIDRPTSGNVYVLDEHLNKLNENQMAQWRGRNIGIIFQFFQLLPTLSVAENVQLPMHFCKIGNRRMRKERALHCLELVGMVDHAHKLPGMLSGGQQQRVAIARALVNDPPLIVGDEPTGNLDSRTSADVFELFNAIVEQGKTMVMVTHDRDLAAQLPRVIEVLDGKLVRPHADFMAQPSRPTQSLNLNTSEVQYVLDKSMA